MHFNLPLLEPPQRVPISTGLTTTAMRAPSLLSRGRSFTSEDLLAEQDDAESKTSRPSTDTDMGDDSDASSSKMSAGMRKLVSSPISNVTNSPPSSLSSHSIPEDIEVDADYPPYTPVVQTSTTFSVSAHDLSMTQATVTTPKGRGATSFAAPHTIDSRLSGDSSSSTTPKQNLTQGPIEPWSAPQLARKTTQLRAQEDKPSPEEIVRDTKRQKVISRPHHRRGGSTDDVFGPPL